MAQKQTMKITKDNFVWRKLDKIQASRIIIMDIFQVFELHDDGSESLITSLNDLHKVFDRGGEVAIEVGFLQEDNSLPEVFKQETNCKGSLELGNGCGNCEGCIRELNYKPITNLTDKL